MAKEERKRLAPTGETLRELYLKSGNRCAYPNCNKSVFNDKGLYVCQVCHIEAAEPGGERFNEDQTNEECRHFSNLLLMCYDHHVETNNVTAFTVDRMRKIKAEHEKKYSDVIGTMLLAVVDHTKLTETAPAKALKKMNSVLAWNLGPSELSQSANEINEMVARLSTIPVPSRQLFHILVERGENGEHGAELEVGIAEVQQATGLSSKELRECLYILDKNGLTYNNGTNDFGVQMVGISRLGSGWPVWVDIRKFCDRERIDLSNFIMNLDFSFLD